MSSSHPPAASADLNLRILLPLARYVREHHGVEGLSRVAAAAALTTSDLDGSTRWISLEAFEQLLEAAHALIGDDAEFKRACAYDLARTQGPARVLVGAISPGSAYAIGGRTTYLISTVGEFEHTQLGPGHMRMRYRSKRPERTRLMCLSRQAQIEAIPTMWGLPPAQLTEEHCMAQGDEACDYVVRYYEPRRWVPAALGLLAGAMLGMLAARWLGTQRVGEWLLGLGPGLIGMLLGQVYELVRTQRANLRSGEAINAGYLAIAESEAEARREIAALGARQREWARLMEARVEERTAMLQQVVERIRAMQESRVISLRGFSHDMRSPLTGLRFTVGFLKDSLGRLDGVQRQALADVDEAALRIERLLAEMVDETTTDLQLVRLAPERIRVAELTEVLRGRLRAMVYGREVRASVFATREAPDAIEVDRLLLDRVVDNLLTNAAKYTSRGSIVVELGGRPGFLSIKISDTGDGIRPERIESIFVAREGGAPPRSEKGFGIGLSVVVRLLAQAGGALEVMSRVGMGTTFWAHFPEKTMPAKAPQDEEIAPIPEDAKSLVERVVTIRKADGA